MKNVILIIADSLRYDFFLESKIPSIWNGVTFKCLTDQIQTGRAVPVILTGKRREKIAIEDNPSHWAPELSFSENVKIRSITAWEIFNVKGYTTGYLNYDYQHQGEETLLTERGISLFRDFPSNLTLKELLGKPPFFAVLHFWSTHSPYGWGTFPSDCQAMYNRLDRLVREGKVEEIRRLYRHGVEGLERQMETLKEILRKYSCLRDTLVVFTGDHGENLGEHGRWGHAATIKEKDLMVTDLLTKEVREVPLVFYNPVLKPEHKGVCKQEDILPTILKIIGLEVYIHFSGRSVL